MKCMKQIKKLMEHIRIDWNALQDEKEIKIIRNYTKVARRYMYAFVGRILNKKIQIMQNRCILSVDNFYL